jgi:hypothetical protein
MVAVVVVAVVGVKSAGLLGAKQRPNVRNNPLKLRKMLFFMPESCDF